MLATPARRRLAAAAAAVALQVALPGMLAGCSEATAPARRPAPTPTPITALDTASMQLPRIEFCALVPSKAVTAALGGQADAHSAYGNGDEQQLPGVGKDVVDEIGCSWTAKDATRARAWVFARPVDSALARTVIANGTTTPGCRTESGPAFGQPSSTQLCLLAGGLRRVRHAGLFGQTWLSCELAATTLEKGLLTSRADSWCVEVATALNQGAP